MPVLREITARMGLQLDKGSFAQGEAAVGGLTGSLATLRNTALAAAGVFAGVGTLKLIELASDADETLNALNASFQGSAEIITTWAASFGTAAGRSEFELREMAASIGGVLNPLLGDSAEKSATMGAALAQLAVDMASFSNATDKDALRALRSGIVGETEPLKKFGIVMLDATLAAFALEKGTDKAFKSMSLAEKTALRYEFIMSKTAAAQGDAIKTADGWANATKGLGGAAQDLGVTLGRVILPVAETIVRAVRDLTRGFLEWQKDTLLLQGALVVLGVVAAKAAVAIVVAFAAPLLTMLAVVAVFALAALAVDDFLVFLDGGDSAIGRFIDSIFGPGSASAALEWLKRTGQDLLFFWENALLPAMRALGKGLVGVAKALRKAWNDFFADLRQSIQDATGWIKRFISDIDFAVGKASKFLGLSGGDSADDVAVPGSAVARRQQQVMHPDFSAVSGALGPVGDTTISNSVTVEVQGNATASDAGTIARATQDAQLSTMRRTRAAVTQIASPELTANINAALGI